jgi:hypothetical protein
VVERSAAGGAPEQIEMSTTLDKGKDKPMDARTAFLAAAAAQLHVTPAPRDELGVSQHAPAALQQFAHRWSQTREEHRYGCSDRGCPADLPPTLRLTQVY